jgi:hypothetical protein
MSANTEEAPAKGGCLFYLKWLGSKFLELLLIVIFVIVMLRLASCALNPSLGFVSIQKPAIEFACAGPACDVQAIQALVSESAENPTWPILLGIAIIAVFGVLLFAKLEIGPLALLCLGVAAICVCLICYQGYQSYVAWNNEQTAAQIELEQKQAILDLTRAQAEKTRAEAKVYNNVNELTDGFQIGTALQQGGAFFGMPDPIVFLRCVLIGLGVIVAVLILLGISFFSKH